MTKIRLTLQTCTPLVMYGADQDDVRYSEPEIRGPSIRGLLRYWLRAVLGATSPTIKELYQAESGWLGNTEQGSRVKIRATKKYRTSEKNQSVLPEKTSKGYSPRFNAFPPETKFYLTLTTHPLDHDIQFAPSEPIMQALFLMVYLGGLGRRARRGSGNLRVVKAMGYQGEADLPFVMDLTDRNAYRDRLKAAATFINNKNYGRRPAFSVFAPDTVAILLGNETYINLQDAYDDLWNMSGPFHHDGGIFGDVNPRRSSAIHMRVVQLANDEYIPQQTIFYAGNGRWGQMQKYLARAASMGYETVYGDARSWK